ncbi:hypothetical protein [Rhodococcus koreensis]|uniref:hypothetical protein n=1 Tax=Rhodococcus koreensis TaxID=99653 RepID=UPI003B84AEBA
MLATGCRPNTDLNDGVRCDARCRVSPGIVAAGDVARWLHVGVGGYLRLENAGNAVDQAAAAARSQLYGTVAPLTRPLHASPQLLVAPVRRNRARHWAPAKFRRGTRR